MSKTHWISVVIASDMPEDEIKQLIKLSYEITESGKRAKNG
jgi:predicted DNA-binding protein (MmcQ/YjbR family)